MLWRFTKKYDCRGGGGGVGVEGYKKPIYMVEFPKKRGLDSL